MKNKIIVVEIIRKQTTAYVAASVYVAKYILYALLLLSNFSV